VLAPREGEVARLPAGDVIEAMPVLDARRGAAAAARHWLIAAGLGSGLIYALYLGLVAFLPFHVTKQRVYLFSAFNGGNAEPFI
jgi:hypothetical protein